MVTCWPYISNAIVKLTQFNVNPAQYHYEAVIRVYQYLNATKEYGLMFWHTQCKSSLPSSTHHGTQPEEYSLTLQKSIIYHNNHMYLLILIGQKIPKPDGHLVALLS